MEVNQQPSEPPDIANSLDRFVALMRVPGVRAHLSLKLGAKHPIFQLGAEDTATSNRSCSGCTNS